MSEDERLDLRVNHFAPPAAGEDAVVTCAFDFQVVLLRVGIEIIRIHYIG